MMYVLKMYLEYLRYIIFSQKIHKLEPGFLMDFAKNCVYAKPDKKKYSAIEDTRKELLKNEKTIKVTDYGQGAKKVKKQKGSYPLEYNRKIKKIAKNSLKSQRECLFMANTTNYFKPSVILELGTSFGITTSYIADANPESEITTIEGCANTSEIAQNIFNSHGYNNIKLVNSDFDTALPEYIKNNPEINMGIIDGNHCKSAVLKYFDSLTKNISDDGFIIIDDIRWSLEMMEAWKIIKAHEKVTLSIDLFSMGITFFNKALKKEEVMLLF